MHGRIECWYCGDVKDGCRCSQHEHVVIYETCVICKSKADSQSQSPFQIKSIEERVVGDSIIYDISLELKVGSRSLDRVRRF